MGGAQLVVTYSKGEAVMESDSVSTIAILKEVITKLATARKARARVLTISSVLCVTSAPSPPGAPCHQGRRKGGDDCVLPALCAPAVGAHAVTRAQSCAH